MSLVLLCFIDPKVREIRTRPPVNINSTIVHSFLQRMRLNTFEREQQRRYILLRICRFLAFFAHFWKRDISKNKRVAEGILSKKLTRSLSVSSQVQAMRRGRIRLCKVIFERGPWGVDTPPRTYNHLGETRSFFYVLTVDVMLLCFIDPNVRKIRNEASSCPWIFSRTLRLLQGGSGS